MLTPSNSDCAACAKDKTFCMVCVLAGGSGLSDGDTGVLFGCSPGLTTEISAIVAKYVRLDCNRAWYNNISFGCVLGS